MSSHVIRDRIWESKKLARCSREAALAYPWIFLVADDWGRFEFNPRRIWSKVFGAREDVSVDEVTRWLAEYEREELLVRYHIDGELAYWTGFQGRPPSQRRESLYPDPSTVTTKYRRKRTAKTPVGVTYKEDSRAVGDPYPLSDQIGSETEQSGKSVSESGAGDRVRVVDAKGNPAAHDPELAAARAECTAELDAFVAATGRNRDQSLAFHSKPENGSAVIVNIGLCHSVKWLRTAASRLRGARLAFEGEKVEAAAASARASPGRRPTAAETTVSAVQQIMREEAEKRDRSRKLLGGPGSDSAEAESAGNG